ncbi:DUF2612 domain-containing protein [Brevibacillus laterosporus]|uniref:DUF2612 domain-containing protein n=2 Tax=Brevibacillus laterosporus TaxID=1465 RepID=A0AAP3DD31_BRELA|nr:DUF2612 domain-containing protein [Brevibacillus laterosporus]MBM7106980.1 hypothetical protein [Brevibacillus laterosporus]MCR8978672.1 DUF2612 domain-containing protein [Brevibacillus laterosporus]MCZ0805828.1 DUF2612 domain-containing protein [Brevibacillus laterosporus]MCZ0824406.1 DUF2612 domain-containing protein [Brevibacillus laterosporus]MCZ0848310.1 DUF2612 domain-containing protein [Brevibacillus laterosporus]
MEFRQLLKKLTDNYVKSPGSNIGKLFRIFYDEVQEIKQTFEKIERYRDIDEALGSTLDRIGKNLNQPRSHLGDDSYRVLLKTKIKRNTSRGDINTIIEVFASVMGIRHEQVYVREVFPAGLYIRVPLTPLRDALFDSANVIGQFVQGTLAAGVGLEVPFEGTFEFAESTQQEFDDKKGFSDLDQETGGYFGGVYKST